MACAIADDSDLAAPALIVKALSMIETSHYILALSFFVLIFLYNFLEFHLLRDILRGFRGDRVVLTFNPSSVIYEGVASRYLVTPWLASPHFQTTFLNFFGRPPAFCYRREIYNVLDGGTIALDWLLASEVAGGAYDTVRVISEDDSTPLVIVVPGLTSDSASPVCDRFINRKLVQRLYDRALAIGLKGYAQLHQTVLTRLANWDGISSSRFVRDFDNHATCIVANFETVDTYYRQCSSVSFVRGVSVPLLWISALDDPVCTCEAIPWDECRANKNIVLATLPHGGHLAFFKGITACSLWWVGAVAEFLSVLYSSPYMHGQKQMDNTGVPSNSPLESSIDKFPYLNIMEDGRITAVRNDLSENDEATTSFDAQKAHHLKPDGNDALRERNEDGTNVSAPLVHETALTSGQNAHEERLSKVFNDMTIPSVNQLSRQGGRSMWLLTYVAIVATWLLPSLHLQKEVEGSLPLAARLGR